MARKIRLGVLGSGKGSNFRAIQEQIEQGRLNAEVRIAISDVENSGILELARRYGIKAVFVPPGQFKTKLDSQIELQIAELLHEEQVDLVVLAGFMRVLKGALLRAFPRRIINIHPSLLPKYRGLEAWKQALLAADTVTGCTVHFVDEGVDTGEIIEQSRVAILPFDTVDTLHARIQMAEHTLLPKVIARLAEEIRP
jgi:phosphoribosylglycinamide formyltransferase-1